LNARDAQHPGEQSVTCRGDFDRHLDDGPLPPGAPPVCEIFRRQPAAIERAAELDAINGRKPDVEAMPMYGVVFSFKDPFDTRDMRSTGGGDAAMISTSRRATTSWWNSFARRG
jgi:amidase